MLLIWLLFPALLLALCGIVAGFGVWWIGRKRNSQNGQAGKTGGLAVTGCASVPLLLLLFVVVGLPILTSMRPSSADFEEGFGVQPGSEIENLRGETQSGPDSRIIYLAFDSTPAAKRVLDDLSFHSKIVAQTDRLDSDIFSGNAPP